MSSAMLVLGAATALMVGVTPATAANIAAQPDTQIAVFMVPLTILLFVMMFEAARVVFRGQVPAETPAPRPSRTDWTSQQR